MVVLAEGGGQEHTVSHRPFEKKFNYFIFDCAGALFLRRLFSSFGKRGLLSLVVVRGLLIALASLDAEHRLWGQRASVVVAPGSRA